MDLKKVRVAVLVEQQYQEMEVWYPVYRLREAGCTVALHRPGGGRHLSQQARLPGEKRPCRPRPNPRRLRCAGRPRRLCTDFLRRDAAVLRLVRGMAEQGKIMAAICHGPWVLCSTPALKGKRATCFFAIKDDVTNAGATYVDAEVVRDGNLITSRKPDDLPAFLRTILQAVQESR